MREWRKRRRAQGRPVRDSSTPEENRLYKLRKYGLTPAAFDSMLAGQGGACAICSEDITGTVYVAARDIHRTVAHIDHCHKTGRVRGLLCTNCNTGIGKFKDDPTRLLQAARYLHKP